MPLVAAVSIIIIISIITTTTIAITLLEINGSTFRKNPTCIYLLCPSNPRPPGNRSQENNSTIG